MTDAPRPPHQVLKSITLTPKHENAAFQIKESRPRPWGSYELDFGLGEWEIKVSRASFEVKAQYGPSNRKQKLLDAGYSGTKADKILDALGEK